MSTSISISRFAVSADTDETERVITSFEELSKEIAYQTVPVGGSEKDIKFPEELNVVLYSETETKKDEAKPSSVPLDPESVQTEPSVAPYEPQVIPSEGGDGSSGPVVIPSEPSVSPADPSVSSSDSAGSSTEPSVAPAGSSGGSSE
ncbi:MAG: hypothetical protein IJU87_06445, partial [Lachnospiraceae bacterium]|nr:hypothetical protein [Lachnospiraceae bacterium]